MNTRWMLSLLLAAGVAACADSPAGLSQEGPSSTADVPSRRAETSAPPGSIGTSRASDACSIATEADLEQATGLGVLSAEPTDVGCVWMLDPGSGQPGVEQVAVRVDSPGGRERFEFIKTAGHAEIPGIGDGAVRLNSNNGGTIWALSGDTMFTFTFAFGIETEDPIPLVLPIVEQAVGGTP